MFHELLIDLGVKHTKFSNSYYETYPYKHNLYGIVQLLSQYNIESYGIKIEEKEVGLKNVECPFLIQMNNTFALVRKIEEDYITRNLLSVHEKLPFDKDGMTYKQLSLFDDSVESADLFGGQKIAMHG